MFKNIGNLFEKRKSYLSKSKDKSSLIKEKLQLFLTDKFGDLIKGFSLGVIYDSKNNSLTIDASNKVMANELTMCLSELSEFLKENEIKLSRILIR